MSSPQLRKLLGAQAGTGARKQRSKEEDAPREQGGRPAALPGEAGASVLLSPGSSGALVARPPSGGHTRGLPQKPSGSPRGESRVPLQRQDDRAFGGAQNACSSQGTFCATSVSFGATLTARALLASTFTPRALALSPRSSRAFGTGRAPAGRKPAQPERSRSAAAREAWRQQVAHACPKSRLSGGNRRAAGSPVGCPGRAHAAMGFTNRFM